VGLKAKTVDIAWKAGNSKTLGLQCLILWRWWLVLWDQKDEMQFMGLKPRKLKGMKNI
jgi:hypothetical protein